MSDAAIFILLFLAVALGFALGRYRHKIKKGRAVTAPWSKKRYLQGLTYLLNDQTDESLDAFFSAMEVSPQTLELHLSLGSLLRRKGEFERAVKVHENLLKHPNLDAASLHLVQYELAGDYAASGLLDRAEQLLNTLKDESEVDKDLRRKALIKLVAVYQDTKEWLQAIDIADRLTENKFADQPDKWRKLKAQFACQLADNSKAKQNLQETQKWARAALSYDNTCARATLIIADLDIAEKKYPAAIASLKMLPLQSPDHASQMLEPLMRCYQALGNEEHLIEQLRSYINLTPDITALFDLYQRERRLNGDRKALEILSQNAERFPSHKQVFQLAKEIDEIEDLSDESLSKLATRLGEMINHARSYFCRTCGFSADKMHWLCPSCQRWATIVMK